MNTILGIKNFRIFDEKGAEIHLRPLTVLTGCNSSGKSSIVKALILLNEFLKGVRSTDTSEEPRLRFNKKPLSLLGNFDSILNNDAVLKGNNHITLSYTVDSLFYGDGISVEMSFSTNKSDIRKDGFLKDITLRDKFGALIYNGKGFGAIKRFFRDPQNGYLPIIDSQSPVLSENTNSFKSKYFIYHLVFQNLGALNSAHASAMIIGDSSEEDLDKVNKEVLNTFNELKLSVDKRMILQAIDFYSKKHGDSELHDLFITDGVFVEKAMSADILTYLPILDVLDSIKKDEFESKFLEMCKSFTEVSSFYLESVKRVIAEFTEGEYQVFSDYYRHIEDTTLNYIASLDNIVAGNVDCPLSDWEHYSKVIHDGEWLRLDTNFTNRISLTLLFELLTSIKDRPSDTDFVDIEEVFLSKRDHRILRDYINFRRYAIRDILSVDICNGLRYVGSNRIDIKRLYAFDSQDNFGYTVSEYFEALRLKENGVMSYPETLKEAIDWDRKNEMPQSTSFIDKWIREFGIGNLFRIETLPEGIGLVLKIYQDENDSEGRILADYGYGVSQLVSILLEIETAILKVETCLEGPDVVNYEKNTANLSKIFTASRTVRKPITIAIEEPEIHLHPRYQSLLADMFLDAYRNYGIHFIVETHSEYLIRKLQNHVGKGILKPDELSFLYVEDSRGSDKKVREIGIEEDGRLNSEFGPGFFDEADSLAMNLLMIKGGLA